MSRSKKDKKSAKTVPPPPVPAIIHIYHGIAVASIIGTPLLFSTAFPHIFEFPKYVYVVGLALMAILATAIDGWRQGRIFLVRTPLDWLLLGFLAFFALATFFSSDQYSSLVGYYTRFNGGLISYLSCAVLFYVVAVDATYAQTGEDSRPTRRRQLLWAIAWAGGLAAVPAVLYHFGRDPLCLLTQGTLSNDCWPVAAERRAFSTLGQPNNLGAFLAVVLPLTASLLLTSARNWTKWLLTAIAVITAWALIYTQSRSAWIGVVVGLAILSVFVPWPIIRSKLRPALVVILAVAVIVVANFGVVSQRAAEGIIEESDEAASTLRTRTLIWQGAVGVIQQHPLIGTGPETFAYAFLPFRAREFNDTVEWNTAYDKAHNEALHLAAGIGLPGTVFWIGLAAVPFIYAVVHARSLWRGRFGGRLRQFRLPYGLSSWTITSWYRSLTLPEKGQRILDPVLFGGMLGGLASLLVSFMLNFSTMTLNVMLFVLLALLVMTSSRLNMLPLQPISRGVGVVLAGVTIGLIVLLGRYIWADHLIVSSQQLASMGDLNGAVAKLEQSVSLNPMERPYRLAYSYGLGLQAQQASGERQSALLADAYDQTMRAYSQGPVSNLIFVRTENSLSLLAQIDSNRYAPKLGELLEEGVALIPTSANFYGRLAMHKLRYADADESWDAFNKVVALRPDGGTSYFLRSRWHQQHGTLDDAIDDLERGLALPPRRELLAYREAQERLGQLKAEAGNP